MDQYNIDPFNLNMDHNWSLLLPAYADVKLSKYNLSSYCPQLAVCVGFHDHHWHGGLEAYGHRSS